MSECTCHKNYTEDVLIPQVGVITDIRQETPDVKTFRVNAWRVENYLNICLDSVPCCVYRESVKECFLLLLHRPIKNIRSSVSRMEA